MLGGMVADAHGAARSVRAPRGARPRRWRGPLAGLVTILAVAVPAMVVAEDWHGHPMIDDPGSLWLVPGAIALAAFFAGGAVAARAPGAGSKAADGAYGRAGAVGGLLGAGAAAILVAADGVRRALVNPTLPTGVVGYWLEAAAAAIVVAALGAVVANAAGRRPQSRGERAGHGPPSP